MLVVLTDGEIEARDDRDRVLGCIMKVCVTCRVENLE